MTPPTVYVDNSTLRSMARCSTEAIMRYHLHWTTDAEGAPLRAGSAVHAALAAYLSGRTADEALAVFDVEYRDWAREHLLDPGDRLAWRNVRLCVEQWFATRSRGMLPFQVRPEHVEVGFAVPLTDDGVCSCGHPLDAHAEGVPVAGGDLAEGAGGCPVPSCACAAGAAVVFTGRIDAIATALDDQAWYLVEHKTTGMLTEPWFRAFHMNSQLSGYIWAAQRHTRLPVIGAFLNAIELAKLPWDPKRKCAMHQTPYAECGALHARSRLGVVQRSPDALVAWRRAALALATAYRTAQARVRQSLARAGRLPQEGTFSDACAWCTFHEWCRVGRPPAQVPVMLVQRPWSPYDHAMAPRGLDAPPAAGAAAPPPVGA